MNNNLKNNLLLKRELRFNCNGKFKILMLSDIQETIDYDGRTLKGIDKIIETEKPDLVILGGDNCDGTILKTEKELREYLDIFSAPMNIVFQSILKIFMVLLILFYRLNIQIKMKLLLIFGD